MLALMRRGIGSGVPGANSGFFGSSTMDLNQRVKWGDGSANSCVHLAVVEDKIRKQREFHQFGKHFLHSFSIDASG